MGIMLLIIIVIAIAIGWVLAHPRLIGGYAREVIAGFSENNHVGN
ncbi:hypothetical protein [Sphingomonas azotifigens]|nr:hypothetical protein [Sphingomonas azotifigens]